MSWPWETRTSTCRNFATISSGLYRFLAIAVLLDVETYLKSDHFVGGGSQGAGAFQDIATKVDSTLCELWRLGDTHVRKDKLVRPPGPSLSEQSTRHDDGVIIRPESLRAHRSAV